MGIARDLVELEAALRERPDIDVFAPADRSGLFTTPEVTSMLARIGALVQKEPAAVMRLCLQALRVQYDEMRPRLLEAELVATLPAETPGIARPTEGVLREMLAPPVKEIILLGYEFTDREMMRLL